MLYIYVPPIPNTQHCDRVPISWCLHIFCLFCNSDFSRQLSELAVKNESEAGLAIENESDAKQATTDTVVGIGYRSSEPGRTPGV